MTALLKPNRNGNYNQSQDINYQEHITLSVVVFVVLTLVCIGMLQPLNLVGAAAFII